MPLYERYVEETHYFREIIEADSPEGAEEVFEQRRRTGRAVAYDVDVNYEHTLWVGVADNA